MPCLPGATPVAIEVHANGVIGGVVDLIVPLAPSLMSRSIFGSRPALSNGLRIRHVAPSSPMTSVLFIICSSIIVGVIRFTRLLLRGDQD